MEDRNISRARVSQARPYMASNDDHACGGYLSSSGCMQYEPDYMLVNYMLFMHGRVGAGRPQISWIGMGIF